MRQPTRASRGGYRRRQATRHGSVWQRQTKRVTAAVSSQIRASALRYPVAERLIRGVCDVILMIAVLGAIYLFLLLLFVLGG